MASFIEANNIDIADAFSGFHARNPIVYKLFQEQCWRAIRRHREKLSSKQIIGFLRWEVSFQTDSKDDEFKINDAYTSHYARLFAKDYPEYEDLFNFRELRASTDTHKKKFLTGFQENILKQLVNNFVVKVGRTLHRTNTIGDTVPLDYVTYNKFLKIKYIALRPGFSESDSIVQYELTEVAIKCINKLTQQ